MGDFWVGWLYEFSDTSSSYDDMTFDSGGYDYSSDWYEYSGDTSGDWYDYSGDTGSDWGASDQGIAEVTSQIVPADDEFPWFIYDSDGIYSDPSTGQGGPGVIMAMPLVFMGVPNPAWSQLSSSGSFDAWAELSQEGADVLSGYLNELSNATNQWEQQVIEDKIVTYLSGGENFLNELSFTVIVNPNAICSQPDLAGQTNLCTYFGGGGGMTMY